MVCAFHFKEVQTIMNNSNFSVVIDNETGFILDETTEEKLANHAAEDQQIAKDRPRSLITAARNRHRRHAEGRQRGAAGAGLGGD